MKKFFTLLLFIFACLPAIAQKPLTDSRTSGLYTFVYRLDDASTLLFLRDQGDKFNDEVLKDPVYQYISKENKIERLPLGPGNYLEVDAEKNYLNYRLIQKRSADLKQILNGFDVRFILLDSNQREIPNAVVHVGKKMVRYDDKTRTYHFKQTPKDTLVKAEYLGVSNFYILKETKNYYDRNDDRKKKVSLWTRIFHPSGDAKQKKVAANAYVPYGTHPGFMIFNKPKYRPNDTVKFKAFILQPKSKKPIEDKQLVVRVSYRNDDDGDIIGIVNAYRKGGFEYQFKLTDSLQLSLDNNYRVSLEPMSNVEISPDGKIKDKYHEKIISSPLRYHAADFRYEEYELKANKFVVRTDGSEQSPGSPVAFYFKSTDDNGLNVADARLRIIVSPGFISQYTMPYQFVPDTLGKFEIPLEPVGETKFIIPDSILPKLNVNLSVSIQLLNSNNESRYEHRSIDWRMDNRKLTMEAEGDSLSIKYMVSGKLAPVKATLVKFSGNKNQNEQPLISNIDLPTKIAIDPVLSGYKVELDGLDRVYNVVQASANVDPQGHRTADSLFLHVDNPRKLKFWYTVFGNKKIIAEGSGTEFDYKRAYKNKGSVSLLVNFMWGGRPQYLEQQVPYQDRVLNIKVTEPAVIYPGQHAEIAAEVTDNKGKPVAGADITAYGVTGKFEGYHLQGIPYLGKTYAYRKLKPWVYPQTLFEGEEGELKLNWEHWAHSLGLDTIKYYQFTHPKDTFTIAEPTPDKVTQLAPFVVKDGDILPVHILYIDERPVYFSQTQEYPQYSFKVDTNYHRIRMRTKDYEVELGEVKVPLGKKLIISVNADTLANKLANISYMPDTLTKHEADRLSVYMIRVVPNFSDKIATLEQNDRIHLLNYSGNFSNNYFNNYATGFLTGPFANANVDLDIRNHLSTYFISEGGYSFEFQKGLIKQKSFPTKYGFNTKLTQGFADGDYKHYVLSNKGVDTLWQNLLEQRASGYLNGYSFQRGNAKLFMSIGNFPNWKYGKIKCALIFKKDDTEHLQLVGGGMLSFYNFAPGEYTVMYLFKGNSYYIKDNIVVKPNGGNYYNLGDVTPHPADSMSKRIGQIILDQVQGASVKICNEAIREAFFTRYLDRSILKKQVTGKVIDLKDRFPLAGVTINLSGTDHKVVTDKDGRFKLTVPAAGSIKAALDLYEDERVTYRTDTTMTLYMKRISTDKMREALILGYIRRSREQTTGSSTIITAREVQDNPVANVEQLLQGKVAGLNIQNNTGAPGMRGSVNIRGMSTVGSANTGGNPLYVVDGVIVNNNPMQTMKQEDIASMEILKDAAATALYGTQGANGVVLITTTKGRDKILAEQAAGTSVRRNFSDYAYWQPKLTSDAEGKVRFKVTYPDDITSWHTFTVGITDKLQTGFTEGVVKSYKPVSANFTAPLFAVRGDTLQPIGKLLNYVNDTMTVGRKFSYNGGEISNRSVLLKNSHIDTFKVVAAGKDSLQFDYALKRANGYADAEHRTIPIFEQGSLETKGIFKTLERDTVFGLAFDPNLKEVTLRAEASALPVLLDEVQYLCEYEYLCNEQLASKLKALLAEKQIRSYLKEPFKWDIAVKDIIKKLSDTRRADGTWGWWKDTPEELWISMHVSEALLAARAQGFTVTLNMQKLVSYLIYQGDSYRGEDKLRVISLLKMLNSSADLKPIMVNYEKEQVTKKWIPEVEKLRWMYSRQTIGLPIQIDSVLKGMKSTMFGNVYWGEERGYHLFNNSIQGSLLAYKILKAEGKHPQLLGKLRNYFLEQRGSGNWRNTYESAQILETILPDMLIKGEKPRPATLNISGSKTETISKFPYEVKLGADAKLNISKSGDLPVYITAYQKFWNPAPAKVSGDFRVDTWFNNAQTKVTQAKGGEAITLTAEVTARADADMVMVEIPIPAGCSYNSKPQGYGNGEVHREYFKNKVSIFCRKLTAGKHTFTISLMPRYSGTYTLNPAKAEMMYFPVFYGREGMKKLRIE